jgi:hypothetical protein
MKRFKTMLTTTAASIAPLQGEHTGGLIPHVLLIGRRGQPFFWSPFQNAAGNHNVAVFGKSGSGKSVFLQDVCAAMSGAGAKVIVIDDGRSFEHMAKAFGGAFVEFKLSSGFSLNPFDMIDVEALTSDEDGEDYEVECLAMLKAIVGQMARQQDRLSDTERGLIDSAVSAVWRAKQREGTIDDVAAALRALSSPFAGDLADAMAPFLTGGTYGRFFEGACSIDLSAGLTVFELSDLSSKPELRSVALTALMFLTLRVMRDLDRSVPKLTMIDEAWQLLGGGQMGQAIETYARTCRKYGGSLITATQSLNDFYKSEGSLAALENSDWSVVLQQKEETINDLAKHQRFEMDRYTETLLRSLKRNGTEYSDVLIKGPETLAVGRLVLDPYSATLYSSSPRVFSRDRGTGAGRHGAARCDRARRLSRFRAARARRARLCRGRIRGGGRMSPPRCLPSPAPRPSRFADACYLALRVSGWLAVTLACVAASGLLFFVMLGEFSFRGTVLQLENFASRYVAADGAERQDRFRRCSGLPARAVRRIGFFPPPFARSRPIIPQIKEKADGQVSPASCGSGEATARCSRPRWQQPPRVSRPRCRARAGWAGCRWRWLAASSPQASGAPGSPRTCWPDRHAANRQGPALGDRRRICPGPGALGDPARAGHRRDPGVHGRDPAQSRGARAAGQIVLVGEAVLAGNVPDITAERAQRSLCQGPMPQPARQSRQAADVMGAMRAAMAGPRARRKARLGLQGNAAGN